MARIVVAEVMLVLEDPEVDQHDYDPEVVTDRAAKEYIHKELVGGTAVFDGKFFQSHLPVQAVHVEIKSVKL